MACKVYVVKARSVKGRGFMQKKNLPGVRVDVSYITRVHWYRSAGVLVQGLWSKIFDHSWHPGVFLEKTLA